MYEFRTIVSEVSSFVGNPVCLVGVKLSLNISINRFCMKYMTINTLCTIVLCVNLPVGLLCIYPHSSQFKGFFTLFIVPALFFISQTAGFYQINKISNYNFLLLIYNIHVPYKSQKISFLEFIVLCSNFIRVQTINLIHRTKLSQVFVGYNVFHCIVLTNSN